MKLLEATKENINFAAEILKNGDIIAFPTETVYGLGADGLNRIAVAKIFEAKNRPTFNPLILHISNYQMLEIITIQNDETIKKIANKFWPGPLTLVIKKNNLVPDIVTSGLDTVAVRMPNHNIALNLINALGRPIAAPSANQFGSLSPTEPKHVIKNLGEKVGYVIDGGKCKFGVESTILEIKNGKVTLLRHGAITKEEIETIVGPVNVLQKKSARPNSPGQLEVHYAPNIPIKFLSKTELNKNKHLKLGGLFLSNPKYEEYFHSIKILSPSADLREATANIFSFLHEFENEKLDLIFVEKIEEKGLGIAIMDRLKKAVNKYL